MCCELNRKREIPPTNLVHWPISRKTQKTKESVEKCAALLKIVNVFLCLQNRSQV